MTQPFSVEGKTAVVTGGSRGIGFGIAKALIAAGARVIITARTESQLNEAAATLGPNCLAIPCDIADLASIRTMFESAAALGSIDVLVNNAGISPYYKRSEHVTLEDWDSVVDINQRGTYFCSVEAANRMF